MTKSPARTAVRLGRIAAIALAVLVLMLVTDPSRVPALVLVLPFAGLYACLYFVSLELIRFLQPVEGDEAAATVRRPRVMAALAAGFPVLLLVLQSIVQLNQWDVLIVSAIFILAYVVVSRGTWPAR